MGFSTFGGDIFRSLQLVILFGQFVFHMSPSVCVMSIEQDPLMVAVAATVHWILLVVQMVIGYSNGQCK